MADPRDAGLLDLRRIDVSRLGPEAQILRMALTTWTRWDRQLLRRETPHRVLLFFDTDGDGKPDYEGRLMFDTGALALHIAGSGAVFEPLEVRSTGPTTVAAIIPEAAPPNPAVRKVRVAVASRYVRRGSACDPGCTDRIPDVGWLQTSESWCPHPHRRSLPRSPSSRLEPSRPPVPAAVGSPACPGAAARLVRATRAPGANVSPS